MPPDCLGVEVDDQGWTLLYSAWFTEPRPVLEMQVVLVPQCRVDVEVSHAGEPWSGMLYLDPVGVIEVDEQGFGSRRTGKCGRMDLRVFTRGAPHHNVNLFDVEVREGVPILIDFPERRPTAPPRELAIRFIGANLPDNVDTNHQVGIECEGQGSSWTCLCPGEAECEVVAKWTDVIFDWSYNSEEVARVPAEQGELIVDLDRPIAELSGVWTGPLPCVVRAHLPEAGVVLEEGCAHDGSFVSPELRAGLWELELGWRIDSFQVGFVLPPLRLQVEIGEDDVDLGSVAP